MNPGDDSLCILSGHFPGVPSDPWGEEGGIPPGSPGGTPEDTPGGPPMVTRGDRGSHPGRYPQGSLGKLPAIRRLYLAVRGLYMVMSGLYVVISPLSGLAGLTYLSKWAEPLR